MSACAILAFFSPCEYRLPQQHLASTLKWLVDADVKVILAQAILPGQRPQYAPPSVSSMVYHTSDIMFFKENLWNLAARSTNAEALFFFDADIVMSCHSWLSRALKALESADVIQPYEVATWLTPDGTPDYCRPPSALALARGEHPDPGKYHPGFAWGMTRKAFDALGGWFDRHPSGGADTAFVYAHRPLSAAMSQRLGIAVHASFAKSPGYTAYTRKATRLALRFDIAPGLTARHLWHGSFRDRGYVTRNEVIQPSLSGDFPVHYRDDGLLEWDDDALNRPSREYFRSRKEDG
jgi:hypothetical protein